MESNHFYKELGLKLKSSRKAKGLTIDAIAKHLNKTSSTISKYENGEIAISLDVLADYCIFLNIDIAMLLPNTYTRQEERSDRYKNLYHDKLWIYWYRLATKKMQTSLIECDNTNLKAYFYFNIRNRNDYHDCASMGSSPSSGSTPAM